MFCVMSIRSDINSLKSTNLIIGASLTHAHTHAFTHTLFIQLCVYFVQLAQDIEVSEVVIEHLPKILSPYEDISSAPKDFSVLV